MADGEINFSFNTTYPVNYPYYTRTEFENTLKYLQLTDPALRAIDDVTPAGFGIWAFDASGACVSRTLTAGDGISIANGTGVAGNPTISLSGDTTEAISSTQAITNKLNEVDASGGAVTVTLPAASGQQGKSFVIVKTDSSTNTVTIDGNAAETINGDATLVITSQWTSVEVWSNGTTWYRK